MKLLISAMVCSLLMLAIQTSTSSPVQSTQDLRLCRKLMKAAAASDSAGKEKVEMSPRREELKVEINSVGSEHKYGEEGGLIYSADYSIATTHSPPLNKHHPKPKPYP